MLYECILIGCVSIIFTKKLLIRKSKEKNKKTEILVMTTVALKFIKFEGTGVGV